MSNRLSGSDAEPQDGNHDSEAADLAQALSEEIENLKEDARNLLLRRGRLVSWRRALLNGRPAPHEQPTPQSLQ